MLLIKLAVTAIIIYLVTDFIYKVPQRASRTGLRKKRKEFRKRVKSWVELRKSWNDKGMNPRDKMIYNLSNREFDQFIIGSISYIPELQQEYISYLSYKRSRPKNDFIGQTETTTRQGHDTTKATKMTRQTEWSVPLS